jgi:tRNA(Ile)-lysidine synthase
MVPTVLAKIRRTIIRYNLLREGDKVVVGVSGGPDSLTLLHALTELRSDFGLSLVVAHLNHMFRGEAAVRDAEFVRAVADRLGLLSFIESVDVPKLAAAGMSSEEAGRKARYEFFEQVAGKTAADKIAVGQNMDDQAETVLLRLLRGAGAEGLAGVIPFREDRVIRPLLDVSRREIEAYCAASGLVPRVDATNLQPIYLRNRIRLQLLPLLENEYNPNIRRLLARTAALLRDENDYLAGEARRLLQNRLVMRAGQAVLPVQALTEQHPAMQRRLVRECIRKISGSLRGIGFRHIEMVLALADAGESGKRLSLPHGLRVEKEYADIVFYLAGVQTAAVPARLWLLRIPGNTMIGEFGCRFEASYTSGSKPADNWEVHLDPERLRLPLAVRTRRAGDRISLPSDGGTKKIKDVLIERKVPRRLRDAVPVVVDATGAIVWVVGHRLAGGVSAGESTLRPLSLRVVWAIENS